jgi:O-antigen/teichoic acid export membrane protein
MPASIAALGVSTYYFAHGNNDLGFAFLFIAVTNSVSNGIGITKGVWSASGDFRMATLSGIPKIIVPFLIILLTILFTKNVTWILLAYFASNVIVSWLGYRFMLWWFEVKSSKEGAEETIRYGKQLSLLGIFQMASGQIDQLLLWHFTTPATLAIYALALAPVNEAQNFLSNFLSPFFNKIAVKSKEDAYRSVSYRLKQMFVVAVFLTVVYILIVPFLFKYLFPRYLPSVLVSQVLALTLLFQPRAVIDTLFAAHAEIGKRAQVIAISQAAEFAMFFVLIPLFGLWGAVGATILSDAGTMVVFYVMYRASR